MRTELFRLFRRVGAHSIGSGSSAWAHTNDGRGTAIATSNGFIDARGRFAGDVHFNMSCGKVAGTAIEMGTEEVR